MLNSPSGQRLIPGPAAVMLKMQSGDTFPIILGAFGSATHLILAVCHPRFAAEGIHALKSFVHRSAQETAGQHGLFIPPSIIRKLTYSRLRVVDVERTWASGSEEL